MLHFLKSTNEVIAEGKQGQTLSFECSQPTEIYVSVKTCSGKLTAIVNPGDRLNVVYSFLGKLGLEKVDMISAGTNPNKL